MKIKKVEAWEILDSRGRPTVKAKLTLEDGAVGQASVPSGVSTGQYEMKELRDGDERRFAGAGVLKAVENVNAKISKEVVGLDVYEQERIDLAMIYLDGTEDKSNLGANAILSVSMATARAAASSLNIPLYGYLTKLNPDFEKKYTMPIPLMNIINGGKHANFAFDFQEFLLIPTSAKSVSEAVRAGAEVYSALGEILKSEGYSVGLGDEGGFVPDFETNSQPFEMIAKAAKRAGYKAGKDIYFGIDVAASSFWNKGKYELKKENKILETAELIHFYIDLLEKYPIVLFEDPFSQDDWSGFSEFNQVVGSKIQVVGDDLYVTNVERIKKGVEEKATNAVLIKLNQIGTVSETIEAIALAKKNRMVCIVSHRSGETEDSFMADLSVAMGSGQIKAGAPARGERTAKYNRLIEIERELKNKAGIAQFPFKGV